MSFLPKNLLKKQKKCNVQIILHQTITPLKTNGWIPKMMVWKRWLLLDMAIFWYLCVLQKPSLVMKKNMTVCLSLECMYKYLCMCTWIFLLCVNCVPKFSKENLPKGRNVTYLENPGVCIYIYIYCVYSYFEIVYHLIHTSIRFFLFPVQ